MFYNEQQAYNACLEDPSLIFTLIKEGCNEAINKLLSKKMININLVDEDGNDILTRLLIAKQFDLVLKFMKNDDWNVNNQNKKGNTFSHYLVSNNYLQVAKIIDVLRKNKKFIPNIKNNNNETILDKSISSNYLATTKKILEDKRFNSIDILSFKNLYMAYIKNSYYGKYSKLNNLEVIVDNLEKKEELLPRMQELLDSIVDNMETIKEELLVNKSNNLERIIDSYLEVA